MPQRFKSLAMPTDNGIRHYNDKGFAPTRPNAEKQYPEEPIRHSKFRPPVRLFHDSQFVNVP
jgi:hypothetical protein